MNSAPCAMGQAQLFDGQTAQARTVDLSLVQESLHIVDANDPTATALRWQAADVHIEAHVCKVCGPPPALLMVSDAACLRTLQSWHQTYVKGSAGHMWRPHAMSRRVGAALTIISLTCVGLAFFGSHLVAERVAPHIPLRWEVAMYNAFAPRLAATYCESVAQHEVLQRLLRRLEAAAPLQVPVQLHLVDWGPPNAMALPGGLVVIESSLVQHAEDPQEVAAVLAHELAHVELRHVMASILRAGLLTALWNMVLGDYTSWLLLDPSTLYRMATLSFSRAAEAEADRAAVRRLVAVNLPPSALLRFLSRVAWDPGHLDVLTSHPGLRERGEIIGTVADPNEFAQALSAEDWRLLSVGCVPKPPQPSRAQAPPS